MEKKNKIIVISLIVLTILVVGVCIYVLNNKKDTNDDALKFRSEYMELNDKVDSGNNAYLNTVISEDNTVKYLRASAAASMLKDKSGVLYLGYASCPLCRSLVPTLTKIAKDLKETIYYVDLAEIRADFVIENNTLVKIKDGSEGYYELVKALDSVLNDFVLDDGYGNLYNTGEKRIFAPSLVAFKNGEITYYHIGTVSTQTSGYTELSKDEEKELENIIKDVINSKQ